MFAQNEKRLETYEARVQAGELPIFRGHELSAEDRTLRRHILNLMTHFETDWERPETAAPYLETVDERLAEPQSDGLVRLSARRSFAGLSYRRKACAACSATAQSASP